MDEFRDIYTALCDGDRARLEAFAAQLDDFPTGRDRFIGRHWLTNAIDAANPDAVAWVLSKGVAVNFIDDEGHSPLTLAVSQSRDRDESLSLKLMDLLFTVGADPDFPLTLGETALHRAVAVAPPSVVRQLLAQGADPTWEYRDLEDRTPLSEAQRRGLTEIVALLRAAIATRATGAAPAAPDRNG